MRDAAFGEILSQEIENNPRAVFTYLDSIEWKSDISNTARQSKTVSSGRTKSPTAYSSGDLHTALTTAFSSLIENGAIEEAFSHAADISSPREFSTTFGKPFREWAKSAPQQSLHFLENAPRGNANEDFMRSAIDTVVRANPAATVDYLLESSNPEFRRTLAKQVARNLARSESGDDRELIEKISHILAE